MESAQNKVIVKMFGGLRISCGDKQLTETEGRAKKVWMLIEYFLANRNNDISQDKLFEASWDEDEEFKSPFNTLKNLVYRARKQLCELDPEGQTEFILFTRNTYTWNNNIDCEIDIEEFQKHYDLASNKKHSAKDRIIHYTKAINLYQGEFLPKSLFANWVIAKNSYYSNMFNDCVKNCCLLLIKAEKYKEVISTCEKAISIYMLEDEFHKFLLYAFLKTGQIKKARDHYDYIADLFYKELNVNISESFRDIYKELINNSKIEINFNNIKKDLVESCKEASVFFCDYDIFRNFYRLQARSMQRTGQSTHIALLTLKHEMNELPEQDTLDEAMYQLKLIMASSLRKSDTVSQYSAAQYVIMLPLTTVENGNMVINRIIARFNHLFKKKSLYATSRITTVDPM